MAKQEEPSVRFFFGNSFNVQIPSGSDKTVAKPMESIGYASSWKHFRLDVGKMDGTRFQIWNLSEPTDTQGY